METKELNLCEILKGHKGETFYSPIYGNIIFNRIIENGNLLFSYVDVEEDCCVFLPNGKYHSNGEVSIFPSKDQRNWNKWIEEQKAKTPKTWSELCKENNKQICIAEKVDNFIFQITTFNSISVVKSALALLKIHQLIEVGYGGNRIDNDDIYYGNWTIDPHGFCPVRNDFGVRHILFHTKEQAEEFLSYPENVQLLKDYFMI